MIEHLPVTAGVDNHRLVLHRFIDGCEHVSGAGTAEALHIGRNHALDGMPDHVDDFYFRDMLKDARDGLGVVADA